MGNHSLPSCFDRHMDHKLTVTQNRHFWEIVGDVTEMFGSDNMVQVCEMVANAWNQKHMAQVREGRVVELSGKMRMSRVQELLKGHGAAVSAAQLQNSLALHEAAKRVLRKQDVTSPSHRDAVPCLKRINGTLSGQKEKHLKQLLDHFEGKPDDYVVKLD